MSMIQAIDVGERSRGTLGIYDINRSAVNPGAVYSSLRSARPMSGHNVLNPGAIRAAAAQAAVEEKKIALEERKQALAEQVAADNAFAQREKLRQDERQKSFEREQAITAEKEKALTGAQDRYLKDTKEGRETEAFDRGRDLQARKDNMGSLMQGIYGRNGEIVKDFINRFGNPKAKVQSVEFADPRIDPKNPEGAIITYEDASTSFFKDNKDLYQGFIAWLDPKIEEALYNRSMKEKEDARKESKEAREQQEFEGKGPLTPKELADYRSKAMKAYKEDPEVYDKATGEKKAGAPSEDQYVKDYISKATGQAEAKAQEGGGGYKEFTAPDGRIKREYADGRVEILKDGKVIAAKDKGGNVINPGPRAQRKGSTIDYGTGEMTPEGEAEVQATKEKESKAKAEGERKAAIAEKKKEATPTGTAEYTDKSTGHQMRVTVYSDGTTKTEKIQSKKKRKKKKDGDTDSNGGEGGGNGGGD